MSLDVYSHAQRAVDAATLEQCDALQAALYARADRDWPGWDKGLAPRTATNIIGAIHGKPSIPARRRPGWLEAIRGVECCDPAVRDQWRMWRVCFLVIGIIVMVAVSAGLVFGNVAVVVVLLAVFAACAAASHRITGGKASVCH
jgi:hypothetical protein